MEHYYLLNGTVKKGSKMPDEKDIDTLRDYKQHYNNWLSSLQPCEISESELDKIELCLSENNTIYIDDNNPIDITDIVKEKCTGCDSDLSWVNKLNIHGKPFISCCPDIHYKIYFKQPTEKQVESDAIECNDNNIDTFINKYINDLPKNWRSDLDMYLAMKNAMIQALSYPNVYKIFKNR